MNDNEYVDLEREEDLPSTGGEEREPVSGIEPPDTGKLNDELPRMVAQIVFQSPPVSLLPAGTPPTQASIDAERYVNLTSPILHVVRYDQCLGGVKELSPTARLIIGSATLLVGALIIKLPGTLAKKKKEKDGKGNTEMETGESREAQPENRAANV